MVAPSSLLELQAFLLSIFKPVMKNPYIVMLLDILVFFLNIFAFSHMNIATYSVTLFCIIYQLALTFYIVSYMPIVASAFDVSIRNTMLGLCYNLSFVLASFAPLIKT